MSGEIEGLAFDYLKKGMTLRHKASGNKVVITELNVDYQNEIGCRVYNNTTGIYQEVVFKRWELQVLK